MRSDEQARLLKHKSLFLMGGILITVFVSAAALAADYFEIVRRPEIENRLKSFSQNDTEREAILKKMFADAGCAEHLSEQVVKHSKQPNLICVLPGQKEGVIIVGAHLDHVREGDGVVDNWSGASLLPSLYEGLRMQSKPVLHTFIFVAFAGEEAGLLGSEAYVRNMSKEDVSRTKAMINLECLGLGPTKVWMSHSDPQLAGALNGAAFVLHASLSAVNVERVGTTDSEQFAKRKIPRITIHSLTQDTLPLLHTSRDRLDAIHLDDYYETYRLLSGYLVYLDDLLGFTEPASQPAKK